MLTLGTTLVEKMDKRTHNAMYFDSNITLTQIVSGFEQNLTCVLV